MRKHEVSKRRMLRVAGVPLNMQMAFALSVPPLAACTLARINNSGRIHAPSCQPRPSIPAWSLVGIVGGRHVRLAAFRHVADRLIVSAGDNLTAGSCITAASLGQVAAQIARAKVAKRPECRFSGAVCFSLTHTPCAWFRVRPVFFVWGTWGIRGTGAAILGITGFSVPQK